MKTFKEFVSLCEEVEDKSKALGFQATIRRQNQGGRIGSDRRISDPERRRANPYKPRKDIGVPKPTSVTVQQPEGERGSSKVAAALMAASKEERKKAALKRIAAKKSGQSSTETKAKPRDLERGASSLLSTKKKAPKPAPGYTPPKPSDLSNKEQKATVKKGERVLRDVVLDATGKKSEKELKHKYTSK